MPSTSNLTRALLRYCEPNVKRSLFELAITAIPLALLWLLMWLSLDVGYWLTLLLAVPAAGFMVRLFIIQHDCGHGAFLMPRAQASSLRTRETARKPIRTTKKSCRAK